MILHAIDPGPELSAFLTFDTVHDRPTSWLMMPNRELRDRLDLSIADALAIEMVASFGMPVGREVFETCVWIGRFAERWTVRGRPDPRMVYRHQVKTHLCGNQRAKDPHIRQALIDRYGPGKDRAIGRKATPGPLYGLTGDCWSALAVAVTAAETARVEAAA